MSQHPIIHVELSCHDREQAGEFYRSIFGWEIQQMPEMNYATFSTGEGVGGGLNPVQESYPAGLVTFYVYTDDVDATLAKVKELGGEIVVPKMEIPGVGWFGFFKDPTGNQIGIMTPLQ